MPTKKVSKMDNKLLDLIEKIVEMNEPASKVSSIKVLFLIYLCDWKSSMDLGHQITNVKWRFIDENFYGGMVEKVEKVLDETIKNKYQESWTTKFIKSLYIFNTDVESHKIDSLSREELKVVSFVNKLSKDLPVNDFIKIVYSTFPMITAEKNTSLDLVGLAKSYKEYYDFSMESGLK